MIRLYVGVEGQTEEAFVNELLGPALYPLGIYPSPRLLGRPGQKGGRVSFDRVCGDVRLLLKQDPAAHCTTFFDFYGVGSGFPAFPPKTSSRDAVHLLERALKQHMLESLPASLRVDVRFIPYFQLHEFEALLFSDPIALAAGIYQPQLASVFQQIREQFPTPEEINNDRATAPSKRILAVHHGYRKVLGGTLAAIKIGITKMRTQCPHFNDWVTTLELLGKPVV